MQILAGPATIKIAGNVYLILCDCCGISKLGLLWKWLMLEQLYVIVNHAITELTGHDVTHISCRANSSLITNYLFTISVCAHHSTVSFRYHCLTEHMWCPPVYPWEWLLCLCGTSWTMPPPMNQKPLHLNRWPKPLGQKLAFGVIRLINQICLETTYLFHHNNKSSIYFFSSASLMSLNRLTILL